MANLVETSFGYCEIGDDKGYFSTTKGDGLIAYNVFPRNIRTNV